MRGILLKIYVVSLTLTASIVVNATVINGSSIYDVYAYEAWLYGYDNSTINTYSGSTVSWLYGYDNTNINISGGDISWLKLYDQSITNITGVEDLSWLLVNDRSEVNIFGYDFSYGNGHLSGMWEDGRFFSFWALDESSIFSFGNRDMLPENIQLHNVSVPEPSIMVLFLMGLAIVSYKTKNKI